jgi:hypothetical protein
MCRINIGFTEIEEKRVPESTEKMLDSSCTVEDFRLAIWISAPPSLL